MSRYKNILVLVSVLLAQIIGLAMQIRRPNPNAPDAPAVRLLRLWASSLIIPPANVLFHTGSGVRGLWSNYLDLRGVRSQNRDLRGQIERLRLEQAALLEDARQGQRLQHLLAFKEHYIYRTVPAQVIGTAGTDQSRILYIDKGLADGLKPDMAVITPDGIVGKLRDVFQNTSQVLEISDQTSGAGVLLESTRLRGVLRGNALGQPQVINMLPDDRVKTGERVITSGGDQIYPRGLPVGTVDRVVADTQNPPYVDVIIKPAANLGRLEELLVITETGDQLPAGTKQDLSQSEAAGIAASQQKASDILSARLPSVNDSADGEAPDQENDQGKDAEKKLSSSEDTVPVLHPLPPLHADRFTPNATPPAADLIPGKTFTAESSAAVEANLGTQKAVNGIQKAVNPAIPKKAAKTRTDNAKAATPKASSRSGDRGPVQPPSPHQESPR